MPVHDFMRFMRDVAEALAAAHRSGVIHRDLKPTNIFLHTDRDGRIVPKILDFGVSKILEEENNTAADRRGHRARLAALHEPRAGHGRRGHRRTHGRLRVRFDPVRGALRAARVRRAELQRAHRDHRDDAAQEDRRRRPGPSGAAARAHPPLPGDEQDEPARVVRSHRRAARFDDAGSREVRISAWRSRTVPRPLRRRISRRTSGRRATDRLPPRSTRPRFIRAAVSVPTSDSGMAAPSLGMAGPSRRTVAITAGMLGVAAVVLALVAAFSRSDDEPHAAAATRATVLSAAFRRGGGPEDRGASGGHGHRRPRCRSSPWTRSPSRRATPPPRATASGDWRSSRAPATARSRSTGVARGTTPLAGLELPAGPHRIDCSPPAGKPKTANVTISRGRLGPTTSSRSTNDGVDPRAGPHMTAELERAIADACLGERSGDVIEHDLRGFLASRGVAVEDVDAILAAPHAPRGVPEPGPKRPRGGRRPHASPDARTTERGVRRALRRRCGPLPRRGRAAHALPARRARTSSSPGRRPDGRPIPECRPTCATWRPTSSRASRWLRRRPGSTRRHPAT